MFHFGINYTSLYDNPGTGKFMINNAPMHILKLLLQNPLLGITMFVLFKVFLTCLKSVYTHLHTLFKYIVFKTPFNTSYCKYGHVL